MKWYHWFIPPLLGLAAYLAAGEVRPVVKEAAVPVRAAERRAEPERSDVKGVIGEFKQQWEVVKKLAADEDAVMPVADLRAKTLALRQACETLPEGADRGRVRDLNSRLAAAIRELGRRQGAEALEAIDAENDRQRHAAMAGWAEVEPEAVFKAVIASERRGSCSSDTLMKLLQGQAEAGNAALKRACAEVRWELFRDLPGDPFSNNGLKIPEDAGARPWIESGAARALAEQGVGINNLFHVWAKRDPAAALAQAFDWPGSGRSEIMDVLGAGLNDPERAEQIRAALEALPAEQFSKVTGAVGEYRESRTTFGDDVAKTFPMLVATKKEEGGP
ncbi:hypothetical protein [Luteolibacter sp. Populi]|uniref:hypothetical protein n=1 Tax=Luteolibacter sp. Populi TaxID=3230487 RepID=UPI003465456A